jgi:magnesium transporter
VTAGGPVNKHFRIEGGKIVESSTGGPVVLYVAPTEAESKELLEVHHLDPHTLQSALDPDEMGRIEFEDDHTAIILKQPCNYSSSDNFLFRVMSTGLFVFKDRLVIVQSKEVSLFEGKQGFKVNTLHDVVLRLVYVTINHFMGHLKVINMLSDELEQKANVSTENRYLLNMFTLEKSLVYFLSALNDNGTVVGKLKLSANRVGFTPENVEFLDDISIDNSQCLTLAQTYSNILSSLMDARASLVGNNLNVMMKNLNAIMIAVAVPGFLASVGGMSEYTMMTGAGRWYITYPLFMAAMVLVSGVTYFLVKRLEKH